MISLKFVQNYAILPCCAIHYLPSFDPIADFTVVESQLLHHTEERARTDVELANTKGINCNWKNLYESTKQGAFLPLIEGFL